MINIMIPYTYFSSHYSVTKTGSVIRIASGQRTQIGTTLKQEILPNGYTRVCLSKNNIQQRFLVHRLVAEQFIHNPENKPCINHKNGNKKDNRIENLEWCSYVENMKHAATHNLLCRFDRCHSVSYDALHSIKRLYSSGVKQRHIANMFGTSQSHVSRIINHKRRTKPCQKP